MKNLLYLQQAVKKKLVFRRAYWNPGSELNVSPAGCPWNVEVKRTSQPKQAVTPLQGVFATIEFAAVGIPQKNSALSGVYIVESGGDLLSRTVTSQVPSALKGLTSVFGMGTGGRTADVCRWQMFRQR